MEKFELGIIGVGNMGKAILSGIARSDTIAFDQIAIYDTDEQKAVKTSQEFKASHLQLPRLAERSKNILIAVKPQNVNDALKDIREHISDKPLIISIAAGVKIETIQNALNDLPVARCMPNTPALAMQSITAISFSKNCRKKEIEFAENLFSSIGDTVIVKETEIDIITAISGSGPAYFFEFTRLLARAGESLGLNPDIAKLLAEKTFIGSAALFDKLDKPLIELTEMVASKGGTTEAALISFNKNDLENIIEKAVESAYRRASELSLLSD